MMNRHLTISVIIVTKNRKEQLFACLSSIKNNIIQPNEIIIINEGTPIDIQRIPLSQRKNTVIISIIASNLSIGRNVGITQASSEILAFTDDDCIVSPTWIKEALYTASTHQNCVGIFGCVKPYQPYQNKEKFCPCTIQYSKKRVISIPCYHVNHIGYGNNMIYRRSIFKNNGMFKTWLGVGSLGSSAEDAEYALRVLTKGDKLFYNPNIMVYHNKWLSYNQMKKQEQSYICGEMACYTYYALHGWKFARRVIHKNCINSYMDMKRIVGDVIKRKIIQIDSWIQTIKKISSTLKGLGVGFFYYGKEKYFNKIFNSLKINSLQ
jgi:GT2 family glycosyltransferase